MKKLFIFIIALVTCSTVSSFDGYHNETEIGTEVVLYLYGRPLDTKSTIKPRSVVSCSYPRVIYNNGSVTITSEILIENVHITLTDNNGMIVADVTSPLTKTGICLQLPDEDAMYKIEIEYRDTYLYGMIDFCNS
ncbi:MAG: DUF3244 domain-containing protein [Prevotella sp.]|nr:DUF3244 domain-containing protein [Prevotella sp.]